VHGLQQQQLLQQQYQQQQQLQHQRQPQQAQQCEPQMPQQVKRDQQGTAPKGTVRKRVTAYALFLSVRQPQLAIRNPDAPQKALKDQLRNTWKTLLPDEKEVWKRQARRWNEAKEVEAAAATAAAARGVGKAAAAAARARGTSGFITNLEAAIGQPGAEGATGAAVVGQFNGNGLQPYQHQAAGWNGGVPSSGAMLYRQQQQQQQPQSQAYVRWQQEQQQQEQLELEQHEVEEGFQADEDGSGDDEEEQEEQEELGLDEPGLGQQGPLTHVQNGQWQGGVQLQQLVGRIGAVQQQQQQEVQCTYGLQEEDHVQQQKHQQPQRKTWPEEHLDAWVQAPNKAEWQHSQLPRTVQRQGGAWAQEQALPKLLMQRQQQGVETGREPQLHALSFGQEQQQQRDGFQGPEGRRGQQQAQLQSQQPWGQQGQCTQSPVVRLPEMQHRQHSSMGQQEQVGCGRNLLGKEEPSEQKNQQQHHQALSVQVEKQQLQQWDKQQKQQQQQAELLDPLSIEHPHVQQEKLDGVAPGLSPGLSRTPGSVAAAPDSDGAGLECMASPPCNQAGQQKHTHSSLQQQQQRLCVAPAAPSSSVPGNSPLEKAKLLLSRQQQAVLSASVGRTLKEQQLLLGAGTSEAACAGGPESGATAGISEEVERSEGGKPFEAVEGRPGSSRSRMQQKGKAAAASAGDKRSAAAAGMEVHSGGSKTSSKRAGAEVEDMSAEGCGPEQLELGEEETKGVSRHPSRPGDQGLGKVPATGGPVPADTVKGNGTLKASAVQPQDGTRKATEGEAIMQEGGQHDCCMNVAFVGPAAAVPAEWPKGLTVCAPTENLIGAEVRGVIEGIAGSGYIAKVQVGEAHFQAVLFSPYLTLATGQQNKT
jgi:hypothetical protein